MFDERRVLGLSEKVVKGKVTPGYTGIALVNATDNIRERGQVWGYRVPPREGKAFHGQELPVIPQRGGESPDEALRRGLTMIFEEHAEAILEGITPLTEDDLSGQTRIENHDPVDQPAYVIGLYDQAKAGIKLEDLPGEPGRWLHPGNFYQTAQDPSHMYVVEELFARNVYNEHVDLRPPRRVRDWDAGDSL